jgi:hypothetical protein
VKHKLEESDDETPEMGKGEEDLSEGEILQPKPTPSREKKKKKGTKLCKKFRQGQCQRGDQCPYLHKQKSVKQKQPDDTDQELLLEEDEKPKSLYVAVCLRYSVLIVVITKSNGKGKYYFVAGIVAFPGAWAVET